MRPVKNGAGFMECWEPHDDPEPEVAIGRTVRTNDTRITETLLHIVDRTQPIVTDWLHESEARDASGLARFASQFWSLPTFSHTYATHLGPGTAATADLARVLRSLEGKFTIVNPRCSIMLPPALRNLVAGPAATRELVKSSRWIAFALHEPTNTLIRHSRSARPLGIEAEFHAALPYRLTVFAGDGRPDEAETLIEQASSALVPIEPIDGVDWFHLGLCLPDAEALRQMTEETAHFYRWITGRLGGSFSDRYWHLDAWEQYTEQGRIHGVVVPEFLRQEWPSANRADDSDDFSDAPYLKSRWAPLTRTHDKRPLVPPGYCFIEFWARISAEVRWLGG
jgi:hypothetical protein